MPHGPSPACLKCGKNIPWHVVNPAGSTRCPHCKRPQRIFVFAAAYRALFDDRPGGREALQEEATCYFFPDRRADYVCAISGRFICEKAATDWEGQKVSVDSLLRLREQEGTEKLQTKSILYDDIALSLAIFPILFFPFTLFSIPTVFYLAIRYWRAGPTSLLRRSRWRYLLAILLTLPQIVVWGLLIAGIASEI